MIRLVLESSELENNFAFQDGGALHCTTCSVYSSGSLYTHNR